MNFHVFTNNSCFMLCCIAAHYMLRGFYRFAALPGFWDTTFN